MAIYKELMYLRIGHGIAFDSVHRPGTSAPQAGIYRCDICGREIAVAQHDALPPEVHPKHRGYPAILWRLLVFAEPDGS